MASTAPGSTGGTSRSRVIVAAQVILLFVGFLYFVELVDTVLGNRLDGAGVRPREADGLDGILFAPVLHAGWPISSPTPSLCSSSAS